MKPKGVPAGVGDDAPAPKSELAGALHEVGNALTVVLGWLDVAKARAGAAGEHEALDVAKSHARLAHRIARRAIGGAVPDEETARAALLVAQEATVGVTPEAQRRGVSVRLVNKTNGDESLSDPSVAGQILLNLLLNGIAFTSEGGSVTVTLACPEPGLVAFQVQDEGPGVAAGSLDALFTAPVSTRNGGTGIGLPHSRALAELAGGTLCLTTPGPGAVFELRWPAAEVKSGARHPSIAAAALGGARILVLEDDAAVRTLLELGLEARGANVVSAGSVEELAAFSDADCFAAVLVDLSPLSTDPARGLAALRRLSPEGPLVMISGSAVGVPEELREAVSAWVRKPFELREVIETLCELVPR